jgi:hypothetical protein
VSGDLAELAPIGEGERVSAAAVMALVRERSARRRAAGQLTDDEVEALARERFRRYGQEAHIDPRLLDRLLDSGVAHDWNIATDYVIRTHRTGPLAALLLAAKQLVAPIVRLYTDHVLDRQTQINQYLYRVLHATLRDNVRLEARLEALEKRGDLAGGKRP